MIISLLAGVYIYTKYCTQPSKILLGNEFILDYKSTYNSEMKNLINSIKLISINYMFSTNNTMHKFGIEYSYIATAMGTMLKSTDNNVKNMEINQTVGIAIDWNIWCDLTIVTLIIAFVLIIGIPGVDVAFDSMLAFWIYDGLTMTSAGIGQASLLWGCM